MNRGRSLALVVAAQFLGAVADGALMLVAIQLLAERGAPAWMVPALRIAFYLAYVLMAAFAGAAADAWPKQRVLVLTTGAKLGGCLLMAAGAPPLLAYALVGIGAVAHAPARYGILAELAPGRALVAANGWMEAATVAGALLGIGLGAALLSPGFTDVAGAGGRHALVPLAIVYFASLLACLPVHAGAAADRDALQRPGQLVQRFAATTRRLVRDDAARTCLLATSVFWSAAAVLQFLVLRWGMEQFGLSLARAALLQVLFAAALIAGAIAAGRWAAAAHAPRLLPAGVLAGGLILLAALLHSEWTAAVVLAGVGLLAGCVLVPMNALLQLRGAKLVPPGQAIASQHFAENAGSLLALGSYGVLTQADASPRTCLLVLGSLVAAAMALLWRRSFPAPAVQAR